VVCPDVSRGDPFLPLASSSQRRRKVIKASTTFRMVMAAVAASMALVACAGGSGGDKAGGETAPVTLRIGTNDDPGKPGAAQIEEFSRQVQKLSKGQVRIEPVWQAAGDADDWDQVVARRVVRGDLDMGMIPARAWDTEGVTSLRALNAPFLVTSDNLAAQIVKGVLAPRCSPASRPSASLDWRFSRKDCAMCSLSETRPSRRRTTKAW
jgi:hypothetical protein